MYNNNENEPVFNRMTYYYDRWENLKSLEIADKCLENNLYLWNNYSLSLDNFTDNIFFFKFSGEDIISKNEYLFTMDYLSNLLSAYRMTRNEAYKEKFLQLFDMFIEYIGIEDPLNNGIEPDLPVLGQVLLVIKAVDILGYIPEEKKIQHLFKQYADWLMNKKEWVIDNNHGLFQIIAQLHLSIFMSDSYPVEEWRRNAIEHVAILYKNAYYSDHINCENSFLYFEYNNSHYKSIIEFCNHYKIDGITEIEKSISESQNALDTLAHRDNSFPVIGDGSVFYGKTSNNESKLFPESNIAVVKIDDLYFSFKNKTEFQAHAHVDHTSITARYKNIDFLIDSGQYNYDRYTPINRFVRSSAGHSSIFPIYADGLFLLDFCNRISYSHISDYYKDYNSAKVIGEYKIDDIVIRREIYADNKSMIIKDSWHCEKPTAIRQRFIIPQVFIDNSRFTFSKRLLESNIDGVFFKYQISTDIKNALTTVQFGVASPEYNIYETTMLLDTVVENSASGEITATIFFGEEQK